MFLRVFSFLLIIFFITSCDKISFSKNKNVQVLDTIVDYSSVDTFPSFKVCDSIIDKTMKSDCFRATIHQKIGAELQQHTFVIKDSVDEIIYVDLIINSQGVFTLDTIQSSDSIKKILPQLDSLLRVSVQNLPKIHAANKRGIPVTIKYSLPIRIKL
ncbi:hypothetical protein [Polaribacter sp. SA4-12]|uniref:hypothetical protein n=1 Tax=Polaribacter sp. SA4-12 TaxID=1312072 RepID=UPI000B3CD742|nr:hypothetical protein [Polaribacter sp. SA4-12]ARV16468.1 hypothetical protein BTO07_15580 [Polaribacter sp. SA4-12]